MLNSSINKASYNKISRQWAESRYTSFVSRLVIEFADRVKPNGTILDVGCGTGHPLGSYLSERGFKITGIDASESMINLARSSGIKNAYFQVSDFFDFDTTDTFDGILAWDSFFHFPKDKQSAIYPRIAELLKPGGVLLFTHGNEAGEINGEMMGEPFYYSSLSKETLLGLLKENRIEVQAVYEDFKERDSDRALVIAGKKMT
jgi:2-polyprenyl-3-methyl-5-hydroxy-6-metoxy-1,4-benzoquinol methylase